MFMSRTALIVTVTALLSLPAWGAESNVKYGFGAKADPKELERFVSPLPDGRGLPAGSGTVARGKEVYDAQCVACHGANLEGGQGDRLIGGRGSLAGNDPKRAPVKTVESYWPYATTLYDYIKRAMPLTAPGSLSSNDVYAVCAYILSRAKVVPDNATLDARTLAQVKMPNRDGFIADRRPEKFPPVNEAKRGGTGTEETASSASTAAQGRTGSPSGAEGTTRRGSSSADTPGARYKNRGSAGGM